MSMFSILYTRTRYTILSNTTVSSARYGNGARMIFMLRSIVLGPSVTLLQSSGFVNRVV